MNTSDGQTERDINKENVHVHMCARERGPAVFAEIAPVSDLCMCEWLSFPCSLTRWEFVFSALFFALSPFMSCLPLWCLWTKCPKFPMWVHWRSSVCVDMYLSLSVYLMFVFMFGSVSIFFNVYHKCFWEFLTPIKQTDESESNTGRERHQEKKERERHWETDIGEQRLRETRKERGGTTDTHRKRER